MRYVIFDTKAPEGHRAIVSFQPLARFIARCLGYEYDVLSLREYYEAGYAVRSEPE